MLIIIVIRKIFLFISIFLGFYGKGSEPGGSKKKADTFLKHVVMDTVSKKRSERWLLNKK